MAVWIYLNIFMNSSRKDVVVEVVVVVGRGDLKQPGLEVLPPIIKTSVESSC